MHRVQPSTHSYAAGLKPVDYISRVMRDEVDANFYGLRSIGDDTDPPKSVRYPNNCFALRIVRFLTIYDIYMNIA